MAYRLQIPCGNQKPPFGTKVNRANPILPAGGGVWLFNEGAGGTAYDGLGNNNGTLNGGVTWVENGLLFNGTTGWISTTLSLPSTSKFFLRVLFFYASIPSGVQVICGNGNSSQQAGFLLFVSASSITFRINSIQNIAAPLPPAGVTNEIWCTFDGAIQKIYQNGALVASRAFIGSMSAPSTNFAIGQFADQAGNFFKGAIAAVTVGLSCPNAAEIQQLYASPNSIMQPRTLWLPESAGGVAFPWCFDEMSGGLQTLGMAA